MARALRVQYPGACYHVINRGNYRRNLFADAGAAEAFERTLGEAATRFGWRVHAYVVMRNHFHIALEIAEPNLSEGMKWLQGTWVRRYNGYRKLVGRPFQGRFKALLVEPGHALEQVCHYIHLNPVRAGAVGFENFFEFRHSSIAAFRRKECPAWLVRETVSKSVGLDAQRPQWANYVDFLQVLSTDPVARDQLCAKRMSRGWCIGGREFRKATAESLRTSVPRRKMSFDGVEPTAVRDLRLSLWAERLGRLAQVAGVDLRRLPSRKSAPEKMLLCAAMKEITSASNTWLARRLRAGAPGGLSVLIKRWRKTAKQRAALERLVAACTEEREQLLAQPACEFVES